MFLEGLRQIDDENIMVIRDLPFPAKVDKK